MRVECNFNHNYYHFYYHQKSNNFIIFILIIIITITITVITFRIIIITIKLKFCIFRYGLQRDPNGTKSQRFFIRFIPAICDWQIFIFKSFYQNFVFRIDLFYFIKQCLVFSLVLVIVMIANTYIHIYIYIETERHI